MPNSQVRRPATAGLRPFLTLNSSNASPPMAHEIIVGQITVATAWYTDNKLPTASRRKAVPHLVHRSSCTVPLSHTAV